MRWWPIRARRLPAPPPPEEMLVTEDQLRRNVEDILVLREEAGVVAVQAWPLVEPVASWRVGVNVLLFFLTILSTLVAGLSFAGSPTFDALRSSPSAARFLAGVPFAFTLMAIL